MSCDFGVWYPDRRQTHSEAGERYLRLCEGQVEGEVVEHPAVAAFYRELTEMHPEIDDIPEERIDDTRYCPWSIAMDRSDGHVIMCCVWSQADWVGKLVHDLARKHGLAMFDPQEGRIYYPDGPVESAAAQPWWRIWGRRRTSG